MKIHRLRFLSGIFLVFSLLCIVFAKAGASPNPRREVFDEAELDCRECHWDIYLDWEQSAHGQGLSCSQCHLADENDHARQGHGSQGGAQECMNCHTTGYDANTDTWEKDDIHCSACHKPINPNHPDEPMPTDRSDDLCGGCHIQAHFEWQTSGHGRAGVVCVTCHNQHATSLKSKDVSEQCVHCHGERVMGFSHSRHHEEGLSCADCHLAPIDGPLGEGSAKRDHSFDVELTTCTACHEYQLHNGSESDTVATEAQILYEDGLDPMAANINTEVAADPDPVSPYGLALLTGGIGLVFGVATTPWVARIIYRKRKEQE